MLVSLSFLAYAHQRHAPGADVGGVHPRPADSLVELHHLLSLLEEPEEGSERSDVERVRADRHYVVQYTGDLRE